MYSSINSDESPVNVVLKFNESEIFSQTRTKDNHGMTKINDIYLKKYSTFFFVGLILMIVILLDIKIKNFSKY